MNNLILYRKEEENAFIVGELYFNNEKLCNTVELSDSVVKQRNLSEGLYTLKLAKVKRGSFKMLSIEKNGKRTRYYIFTGTCLKLNDKGFLVGMEWGSGLMFNSVKAMRILIELFYNSKDGLYLYVNDIQ